MYTEEKDMFLVDLMSRYGGDNKFEFGAWLGATDNTTEGQWIWTYSGETARSVLQLLNLFLFKIYSLVMITNNTGFH